MPNKYLKTLFLYNGIFVFAGSLLGPLYALYVEKLGSGIFPVSVSWAVFLFSTTLFTYLISKLGDRFNHKQLLLGGYLVRMICWLVLVYISNIEQLIVVQFVLGIGEAFGTPAWDAIFAEHLDNNKHIMDYSDWKVVSNGVLVLGTLLGGFIVSSYRFKPMFGLMAIFAGVSFVGILSNETLKES